MKDIASMRPWQRRAREEEIHTIALAQLRDPVAGFAPLDLLEELSHLSPRKNRTVANLEATILLCVGAQIRPTRTRKALVYLRDKQQENGTPEAFTAFETLLKELTGTDVLLAHGFAPTTFSSLDHGEVWDTIGDVLTRLQTLTGPVFLNSGTLLGVTRDKALIAHDDDIDLAVRLPAGDAETAARQWIALRDTLKQVGLFDADRYNRPEILKVRSGAAYQIDLFPAWEEDGQVYVYPHTAGELRTEQVYPTRSCAVTGYPIPAEPEAMLALNYGDNWQVPDPYFKFPWGPAKRRFEAFLKAVRKEDRRAAPEPATPKYATVVTYGTFDLFHVGHLRLLRRLSELADRVIVGCSTDAFNALKGKETVVPYADRVELLRSCVYVSDVFAEESWEQKPQDLQRFNADLFAMGDDWAGHFDDLRQICDVLYLPRTEGVSTTDLKVRAKDITAKNTRAA